MEKKPNTKELLAESLLDLSKKIPIDKITVSDITKNCGVSRRTFYNVFVDKYDLIEWIYARNCSQIADTYAYISPLVSCTKMITYLFQNFAFYKNLARKRNEDIHQLLYCVSYSIMEDYIIKDADTKQISEEEVFQLSCYVHGSITKILEWFNSTHRISEETIARYITLAWPVGLAKYLHIQDNDISGDISFHMRKPDL